jgi:hypothetical protein
MMIHKDHVKCQNKKWTLMSSVFWIMKMISATTAMSEKITPALIRARCGTSNLLAQTPPPAVDHHHGAPQCLFKPLRIRGHTTSTTTQAAVAT